MESSFEYMLMHSYKAEMVEQMQNHPEYYPEAIRLALGDKQPYSWRSAFLLIGSIQKNDARIKPFIDQFIDVLPEKKDGHQRDILNILNKMDLNEAQEGYVLDRCISLWESTSKKPSVRFVAFKMMIKMAEKYPELANEIKYLTEEHYMEPLTPGARRSIAKMAAPFRK